jgi:hypothetical protein
MANHDSFFWFDFGDEWIGLHILKVNENQMKKWTPIGQISRDLRQLAQTTKTVQISISKKVLLIWAKIVLWIRQ